MTRQRLHGLGLPGIADQGAVMPSSVWTISCRPRPTIERILGSWRAASSRAMCRSERFSTRKGVSADATAIGMAASSAPFRQRLTTRPPTVTPTRFSAKAQVERREHAPGIGR
jgi:hypothetical protein